MIDSKEKNRNFAVRESDRYHLVNIYTLLVDIKNIETKQDHVFFNMMH